MTDTPTIAPEVVPFDNKISISCVTKSKGPLTKIIKKDTDGSLIKDGSKCSMSSGTLITIQFSSPAGFARFLRTRESNQAIVHGVTGFERVQIITKNQLEKAGSGRGNVIARTKEFLKYPKDGSGVVLLDHDKAREGSVGEDKALRSYTPSELIQCISEVFSEIVNSSYVSTPSTSSCIYDADGNLLRGEGTGSHTYLFVKNAADIPRFLQVLGKHLILAGYGRIEISRSGAILIRTIIDLMVGSPERLDFVAGAVCEDGLTQKLPDPVVHNGDMLDTTTLPDLTEQQEEEYKKIIASLIEQAKPVQEKVKTEYIEKESVKLSATKGITVDAAKDVVISRQNHVLQDDDILYFAHMKEGVSVAGVLEGGEQYHLKSLADPLEPDYEGGSKNKAKFYWNDGNPIIHSYAHGSFKYIFERFRRIPKEEPSQEQAQPWFAEALNNSSVSRFIDNDPPVLEWVFKGTLLARTTGMLVGPGAAGKSTLALMMLIAAATGRDILPGIFTPIRAGKVLGVFAEDDETIIHHRMHTIVTHLFGHDPKARELLRQNMGVVTTVGHDVRFLSQSNRELQESAFFQEVFDSIKGVEDLRLIVLDPVSRYHGAEENDNNAGTFLVGLIERIAQKTGAAVIILHHVGKRAGSAVHGFDLDAAMHQDASRGASGLTNGVRWQCNLFGLPEKNAKQIIGASSIEPGQHLALKVCKKNYGPPEPVFYLERLRGGILTPCEPKVRENDADLEDTIKGLVLDAVLMKEKNPQTKRVLIDGYPPLPGTRQTHASPDRQSKEL